MVEKSISVDWFDWKEKNGDWEKSNPRKEKVRIKRMTGLEKDRWQNKHVKVTGRGGQEFTELINAGEMKKEAIIKCVVAFPDGKPVNEETVGKLDFEIFESLWEKIQEFNELGSVKKKSLKKQSDGEAEIKK